MSIKQNVARTIRRVKEERHISIEILAKELEREVNDFLSGMKKTDRIIFVRRYWFLESISEIAESMGWSSNYVTVHLHRSRKRLEKDLKGKGLIL